MGLTLGGIIFLSIAWGSIIILSTYCFYKVIKSERRNK
ncbi:hypothetical protein BMS3Abin03_01403 [bacterium BMS3Abin03]|nr:hypothetical protein BMS3Abin03_01403 [bacterium BMS3Abin03]